MDKRGEISVCNEMESFVSYPNQIVTARSRETLHANIVN